jgi:monovalent cation:H+ antiporter-2, CPA2 family
MGDELLALGGAFLAAGVVARLGRRIGLPTIPLFMLAGIVFGPQTPGVAFVEDPRDLALLASLGLVLLLFYLGLEFTVDDLVGGGCRLAAAGGIYLALNIGAGLAFGFALGWGAREALVIAGVVGISSSAIVTKLLVELHRLANPETRLILGIVVVEDLFVALYLAILQPVLSGTQGVAATVTSFGKAFAFLVILAVIARWGSGFVGLISSGDDELFTVCFIGLAVLAAGLAEELGVSEAIGAFMIGVVLAATPSADRIKRLVLPLRDAFAAVFFFAFGLSINVSDLTSVAGPIGAAVVLTVVFNAAAGLATARLYRLGAEPATNVGVTMLARGEFSLVLAAVATGAGLDARLSPFVAGYVLVLAIAGPLLASRAPWIARRVPAPLISSGDER